MEDLIDKFIEPGLLEDNHHGIVEEDIRHDYSEEELIELKEAFFLLSNSLIREDALALFKEALTNYDCGAVFDTLEALQKMDFGDIGIKQLKEKAKTELLNIRAGYEIKIYEAVFVPLLL